MHEILAPAFQRVDERGSFIEVINGGRWEDLLCGRMKRDAVMGNHYHKKTEVFFFLTEGRVQISTVHVETGQRERFILEAKQGVVLGTLESHAIRFLEDSSFIMLKSLRYDPRDDDTFSYPVEPED